MYTYVVAVNQPGTSLCVRLFGNMIENAKESWNSTGSSSLYGTTLFIFYFFSIIFSFSPDPIDQQL